MNASCVTKALALVAGADGRSVLEKFGPKGGLLYCAVLPVDDGVFRAPEGNEVSGTGDTTEAAEATKAGATLFFRACGFGFEFVVRP